MAPGVGGTGFTTQKGETMTDYAKLIEDLDRDDYNPNDMDADDYAEFFAECERRTGMSFEEYLDHDTSMNW